MTTRARPGPRWTNSMWRSAPVRTCGATTSPAQRDRPDSALVAWSSTSGRLRPAAAHWPSMDSRVRRRVRPPTSSRPWTNRRRPDLGRQAAGRGMRGIEQARHPPDRPSHCGWSPATATCRAAAKACASRPARRSRHRRSTIWRKISRERSLSSRTAGGGQTSACSWARSNVVSTPPQRQRKAAGNPRPQERRRWQFRRPPG